MPRTRRTFLGAVAGSLVLAGCVGGDDSEDGADDSTATPTSTDDGDETETSGMDDSTEMAVQVVETDALGTVLAGPDGMTLYMFDNDEQGGTTSACTGGCAENWPPLTVDGEPTATADVDAELSTIERDDGSMQVTANGWPLYYWANDSAEGDTNGQGVNDVWYVLDPSGVPRRDTDSDGDGSDGGDGGDGPDY